MKILLINGQDKIFYNDLLFEEKTIDCINAIEDVLKEVEKYNAFEDIKRIDYKEIKEGE